MMLAMASLAHASANAYLAYTYPEAHGEEVRATRWLLAGTLVPPWLLLLLHRLRAATATATAGWCTTAAPTSTTASTAAAPG